MYVGAIYYIGVITYNSNKNSMYNHRLGAHLISCYKHESNVVRLRSIVDRQDTVVTSRKRCRAPRGEGLPPKLTGRTLAKLKDGWYPQSEVGTPHPNGPTAKVMSSPIFDVEIRKRHGKMSRGHYRMVDGWMSCSLEELLPRTFGPDMSGILQTQLLLGTHPNPI